MRRRDWMGKPGILMKSVKNVEKEARV